MKIHDPGNTQPISSLYAVLSVDENGNEGILGTPVGPAVCGYEKTAWMMFEYAKRAAYEQTPKYKIRLARFETKTILE